MRDKLLATMSADDLWQLRERLGAVLSAKLDAEIRQIQRRLARVQGGIVDGKTQQRHYPKLQSAPRSRRTAAIKTDELLIGH